jgi:hypothetical protein
MANEEFDKEIERLKIIKTEISNKMSLTNDFNERDKLQEELARVNSQIRMLEIFKKKF